MRFSTRPAPVDVGDRYPELKSQMRETVRLHPRRRIGLAPTDSKIGGVFYANAPESWPRCEQHDTYHIGFLQLTKSDVPELVFPEDSDLFQLTLCPFDHSDAFCPEVSGRWLSTSAPHAQQTANPPHATPAESNASTYVPNECALHPERVYEFPSIYDLSPALETRIKSDFDLMKLLGSWYPDPTEVPSPSEAYQLLLSVADGTKVGGFPNWIQYPELAKCAKCAERTEYLLTVASWEWDAATEKRWKPLESKQDWPDQREDHGVMFGDAGALYVGVCRMCDGLPISRTLQSS